MEIDSWPQIPLAFLVKCPFKDHFYVISALLYSSQWGETKRSEMGGMTCSKGPRHDLKLLYMTSTDLLTYRWDVIIQLFHKSIFTSLDNRFGLKPLSQCSSCRVFKLHVIFMQKCYVYNSLCVFILWPWHYGIIIVCFFFVSHVTIHTMLYRMLV